MYHKQRQQDKYFSINYAENYVGKIVPDHLLKKLYVKKSKRSTA